MQKVEIEKTVGYLHPDKISLFKDQKEAFMFLPYSHKRTTFICPKCGTEKEMIIDNAIHRNFFCKICNDKISMPNKMIRDIGFQLKEQGIIQDFDLEYIVPNSGTLYRFDLHFIYKNIEYFIEAHGSQHKDVRSFKHSGNITQERDKLKIEFVASKEDAKLIVIWCDKDNFEYRKNNFVNGFKEIGIDLNKVIDWGRVERSLVSNLMIDICNYYKENSDVPLYKAEEIFKLTVPVITKYLNRGTKLGFCNYDTHKHKGKLSSKIIHAPKVLVYKEQELLYIFSKQAEASRELSKIYNKVFNVGSISGAIRKQIRYHGFIFRYINNPLTEEIYNNKYTHKVYNNKRA